MSKLPEMEDLPVPKSTSVTLAEDGWLLVDSPMGPLSLVGGFRHGCVDNGKAAQTMFKPLEYDAETDTTLVHCRPLTGRTHQIRVHLQLIGHEIANDTVYGGDRDFPAPKEWQWPCSTSESLKDAPPPPQQEKPARQPSRKIDTSEPPPPPPTSEEITEICTYCVHGPEVAFTEEQLSRAGIWLHAFRYEVGVGRLRVPPCHVHIVEAE